MEQYLDKMDYLEFIEFLNYLDFEYEEVKDWSPEAMDYITVIPVHKKLKSRLFKRTSEAIQISTESWYRTQHAMAEHIKDKYYAT